MIVADGRGNKIHAGRGDDIICAKGGRDKIHARGPGAQNRIKAGPEARTVLRRPRQDHLGPAQSAYPSSRAIRRRASSGRSRSPSGVSLCTAETAVLELGGLAAIAFERSRR